MSVRNYFSLAILAGIIAFSSGAKAQSGSETLDVSPTSGMQVLFVDISDTYVLLGASGVNGSMYISQSTSSDPFSSKVLAQQSFYTGSDSLSIQVLGATTSLNGGQYDIIGYDEWQTPLYDYNAPQVTVKEVAVTVTG